jgi:hypothetical protein
LATLLRAGAPRESGAASGAFDAGTDADFEAVLASAGSCAKLGASSRRIQNTSTIKASVAKAIRPILGPRRGG